MMTHKERMVERRQKQLDRVPGFTPVRSQRVDSAFQVACAGIALAASKGVPLSAAQIEEQAIEQVRRLLPPEPMQRRAIRRIRPSRSDQAAYRNKPNIAKPLRRADVA